MVWQFMPHAAEARAAQAYLLTKGKAPQVPRMPAYVIDGLVYQKRGKEVRPVFLCKKDLDAALARLAEQGTPVNSKQVIVMDLLSYLLQLVEDIELGVDGVDKEVKSIELVPPTESVDFREQIKKDKVPLKARIVPPDHSGGRY